MLADYPAAGLQARMPGGSRHRGLSGALVWRVETAGQDYCLRGWPPEMVDETRLVWMHRMLLSIHRAGFSIIPIPLATRRGGTHIQWHGRFWELTQWMPGRADYHQHSDPCRLKAAVDALATFHRLAAKAVKPAPAVGWSPALNCRADLLDEFSNGGLPKLREAISRRGSDDSPPAIAEIGGQVLALFPQLVESVTEQVRDALARPLPLGPCHGDLWHDHVLFTGTRVSAFIDFGNLRLDTPVTDLARLLGSLVGDDQEGWRLGVQAYGRQKSLGPDQQLALEAVDRSTTLLAGLNWLRWIYIDGRTFPWPVVRDRLTAILRRMEAMVRPGAILTSGGLE